MFLLGVAQNVTNDEMVKQMQDQVISMQEKQISFLNDTISNTYTALGVIVALVAVFAAGVLTWISRTNLKAQKTMQQAEQLLGEASEVKAGLLQDKADLAAYREETRMEFEALTKLVNSDEIVKMKEDTKVLATKQRAIAVLNSNQELLNYAGEALQLLKKKPDRNGPHKLEVIFHTMMKEHRLLNKEVWNKVYDSDEAENLLLQCLSLKTKCEETLILIRRVVGEEMNRETKARMEEEEALG